jgi:hypothetical protein
MTDLEKKVCSLRSILRDLLPTHEPQVWMDLNKDGLIPGYVLVRLMAKATTPRCSLEVFWQDGIKGMREVNND